MIEAFAILLGIWIFVLGAVIGSFVNVCIYRIPWEKSVIWPSSHCPRCLQPIAAWDNIPILSWLILGGHCRKCHAPIAPRYALVELLVASLFLACYLFDVVLNPARGLYGLEPYYRMIYHQVLLTLLVVATFIDYDLQIIPDQITVTGVIVGLAGGALFPAIRPDPNTASTWSSGLVQGLIGLAVGAGLTQSFRLGASLAFRREAMGFGDVTLMAMIGSFLGWQAAVLTFFLAPFSGILHALLKVATYLQKRLRGVPVSSIDREMPFGPYLSMAAAGLLFGWPWIWQGWAQELFATLRIFFHTLLPGS